jgi:hypothetical protein
VFAEGSDTVAGTRPRSADKSANSLYPEPLFLMLRCFGIRPEGAEQISPGQRPGNGNSREKQALKGRNKGLAMLRPFRARADALQ